MQAIESNETKYFSSFSEAVDAAVQTSRHKHLMCVLELAPDQFSIVLYAHLEQVPFLLHKHIRLIIR